MITDYIQAAMTKAKYEILDDDGSYYGHIPGLKGVWSNAKSLEMCRQELQEVLEGWILVGIRFGDKLPVIKGRRLKIPRKPSRAVG